MPARKPFVLICFLLALAAIALLPLAGNRQAVRAERESGKRPRAVLLIERHSPRMFSSAAAGEGLESDTTEDYKRFFTTQCVLIKSGLVLNAVLRSPAVARLDAIKNRADPIGWLQQYLETVNLNDSEVLHVSLAAGCGASAREQADLVNGVIKAYMEEVANVEIKRRAQRYDKLKRIRDNYQEILAERRETLRRLSESAGGDDHFGSVRREALPALYQGLRTQRITLRLERAEAEALLALRNKAAGAATEPLRREIDEIEARLAVVSAREKVVAEELERVTQEIRDAAHHLFELKAGKDELAQFEEASQKVCAEVEALNIELDAPSHIRRIENAVSPSP